MVSPPSQPQRRRSPPIPPVSASGSGSYDRSSSSQPSSSSSRRLEDYRRLRALDISDPAFHLVADGWRKSTSRRYDAIWDCFKDFLHSRGISLNSINLNSVLSYLTFLFEKGLAYRTVCLHRSVLSMTLPPQDGIAVGDHDLVKRLIKGIFHRRPPHRRLFQAWDVGKVFTVFSALKSPLDFRHLLRKTAFLLAMASARRPSELASLRCAPAFMIISTSGVRFLPSSLSKTDRDSHLGPPLIVSRLPAADSAICPVSSLEALLRHRLDLGIEHDFIFSQFRPPFARLSSAGFARLIAWALKSAGISAPPSSTRSISVSDAYARGVNVEDILRAGDWSGAQTFFRHYLRPSASSCHQE